MNTLPPGYTFETPPAYVSTEDCMGNPRSYWTQMAFTPHKINKVILSYGQTPEAATAQLCDRCWEDHNFRTQAPDVRLAELIRLANEQGRFYDGQLVDAIAIITKKLGVR